MPQRRPVAWGPVIAAMAVGAAVAGVVAWQLNLQTIDAQIEEKRGALKKLLLSGRIPPNDEVVAYLASREVSLERRYEHWVERVAAPPLASAASADPQLYFQEQFHDVQRTLERLAAARNVTVPEQLGFPKELPPSDTVPRLLVQLSLIQEVATLIFDQGGAAISSLKVEDPEAVAPEADEDAFLTRLPVRVRMASTLPQLMKVLGALERVRPLIDIRAARIGTSQSPDQLEVELGLARYLVSTQPSELGSIDARDRHPSVSSNATSASPSQKPKAR